MSTILSDSFLVTSIKMVTCHVAVGILQGRVDSVEKALMLGKMKAKGDGGGRGWGS